MKLPSLVYIKVNADGSLGRAYLPEQINWNAEPPPGVQYIPFERNGTRPIFEEGHKKAKRFPLQIET